MTPTTAIAESPGHLESSAVRPPSTRDQIVMAIKGLAIVGVVFHHILTRRADSTVGQWLQGIISAFDWCVLAFICVSGYLHALSEERRKRTVGEFVVNRLRRLMIPYFALFFFYACVWQILQALRLPDIGARVPVGFWGKLASSLWPVNNMVAQQLYYLPLLFAISCVVIVAQAIFRVPGLWALAIVAFICGLTLFPAEFTGFSLGVFTWGIFFYAFGYLLFQFREQMAGVRLLILVLTVVLICVSGWNGLVRAVPLWLLACGPLLRLDRWPLLSGWGEASGTIYVYHTPFIVLPLGILAYRVHGAIPQFASCIAAVVVTILTCYAFHFVLRNTRAKILLM
jgi:peptidoglycan/LPS O-acetylase OafA/YrhL